MTRGKLYFSIAVGLFLIILATSSNLSIAAAQGSGIPVITYYFDTGTAVTSYTSQIVPLADGTSQDGYIGADPTDPNAGDQARSAGADFSANDAANVVIDDGISQDGDVGTDPTNPVPGDEDYDQNIIIPPDDRKPITNTSNYPWRTICSIQSTFPNGTVTAGSGTLIGKRYVLTAGHVVNNPLYGGWAMQIRVIPGLNGDYKPYNVHRVVATKTFDAYIRRGDPAYDIAVMKIDSHVGSRTGWLGLIYYRNVVGRNANLSGYPLDKDPQARKQWRAFGSVIGLNANTALLMNHTIDAEAGQSGASIYTYSSATQKRFIFAVHKGGGVGLPAHNIGVYLDAVKFKWVSDAVNIGF